MRHIRCAKCMEGKQEGTRQLYPRSEIGEPAEFERVVIGVARQPQRDQPWMSINGDKRDLPLEFYNCDGCNAQIKPGDRCGCWTVWTEDMGGIVPWEHEYLEQVPVA